MRLSVRRRRRPSPSRRCPSSLPPTHSLTAVLCVPPSQTERRSTRHEARRIESNRWRSEPGGSRSKEEKGRLRDRRGAVRGTDQTSHHWRRSAVSTRASNITQGGRIRVADHEHTRSDCYPVRRRGSRRRSAGLCREGPASQAPAVWSVWPARCSADRQSPPLSGPPQRSAAQHHCSHRTAAPCSQHLDLTDRHLAEPTADPSGG